MQVRIFDNLLLHPTSDSMRTGVAPEIGCYQDKSLTSGTPGYDCHWGFRRPTRSLTVLSILSESIKFSYEITPRFLPSYLHRYNILFLSDGELMPEVHQFDYVLLLLCYEIVL
jgi:hypothetical protein